MAEFLKHLRVPTGTSPCQVEKSRRQLDYDREQPLSNLTNMGE